MEARLFKEDDHSVVCSWWESRGWPAIPLDLLPQTGAIVEDKAAGFLYRTDSGFAWIEWVVAAKGGGEAVPLVLEFLLAKAKEFECTTVFSSLSNDKLISMYKKAGFVATDSAMTNMLRRL